MEKMVHKLPIALAHTTSINHNDMPLPKVVHGKISSQELPTKQKKLLSKEPWSAKYSSKKNE